MESVVKNKPQHDPMLPRQICVSQPTAQHRICMRIAKASLVAQSLFYIFAGINHFWHQRFYVHIMPDHYVHPDALVRLSGIAEILGGIGLLVPFTRRTSSVGIAAMLIVFFDVHFFMLRHADRFPEAPRWVLWARLPLQLALIAWALYYARSTSRPHALTSPGDSKPVLEGEIPNPQRH
jgi:uncharacterized membrane protein